VYWERRAFFGGGSSVLVDTGAVNCFRNSACGMTLIVSKINFLFRLKLGMGAGGGTGSGVGGSWIGFSSFTATARVGERELLSQFLSKATHIQLIMIWVSMLFTWLWLRRGRRFRNWSNCRFLSIRLYNVRICNVRNYNFRNIRSTRERYYIRLHIRLIYNMSDSRLVRIREQGEWIARKFLFRWCYTKKLNVKYQ